MAAAEIYARSPLAVNGKSDHPRATRRGGELVLAPAVGGPPLAEAVPVVPLPPNPLPAFAANEPATPPPSTPAIPSGRWGTGPHHGDALERRMRVEETSKPI